MQLISKHDKAIKYLLRAIDLFSKYTFIVPLKDKKGTTITNEFQSILNKLKRKPDKIRIYQGSGFYNIPLHSAHNEGKSVVAERFIRTLKNKIYKQMTANSKNVYCNVLSYIVNKQNNTYHKTIKVKPTDVKSDSFAEYNEESNEI